MLGEMQLSLLPHIFGMGSYWLIIYSLRPVSCVADVVACECSSVTMMPSHFLGTGGFWRS